MAATILPSVQLYLVRHAEAADGEPDELRPLTPEGRRAARELGERLAADGIRPDAVLTSPLLRARETGAELARPAGLEPESDDRLAPGATAGATRAMSRCSARPPHWPAATGASGSASYCSRPRCTRRSPSQRA